MPNGKANVKVWLWNRLGVKKEFKGRPAVVAKGVIAAMFHDLWVPILDVMVWIDNISDDITIPRTPGQLEKKLDEKNIEAVKDRV